MVRNDISARRHELLSERVENNEMITRQRILESGVSRLIHSYTCIIIYCMYLANLDDLVLVISSQSPLPIASRNWSALKIASRAVLS